LRRRGSGRDALWRGARGGEYRLHGRRADWRRGVIGTITTDGATGVLSASDILAWNLTLYGDGASYTISSPSSSVLVVGSDVVATPTKITFDFSGNDSGYLLFQETLFSGMHYWCSATSLGTCLQSKTVTPQSIFDSTHINEAASGVQTIAFVPEPSTWMLMGLGFGALALAAARKGRSTLARP
jgi:hypothetical protein